MTAEEETRKIIAVESELAMAHPDVPPDRIKDAVKRSWMGYAHATIRDFVPLLVHREATARLRGPYH